MPRKRLSQSHSSPLIMHFPGSRRSSCTAEKTGGGAKWVYLSKSRRVGGQRKIIIGAQIRVRARLGWVRNFLAQGRTQSKWRSDHFSSKDRWTEDIIQVEDGDGRSISRAGSVARLWQMPRSQAHDDGRSARSVVGSHPDANFSACLCLAKKKKIWSSKTRGYTGRVRGLSTGLKSRPVPVPAHTRGYKPAGVPATRVQPYVLLPVPALTRRVPSAGSLRVAAAPSPRTTVLERRGLTVEFRRGECSCNHRSLGRQRRTGHETGASWGHQFIRARCSPSGRDLRLRLRLQEALIITARTQVESGMEEGRRELGWGEAFPDDAVPSIARRPQADMAAHPTHPSGFDTRHPAPSRPFSPARACRWRAGDAPSADSSRAARRRRVFRGRRSAVVHRLRLWWA
ncbi:hypothetical protein B0H14DRAFT_3544692 [Mycena olivaceomarginata]|nr:hypothetical protein B0H14DRAFT_3544692 [Mycena olivaceomarginata]